MALLTRTTAATRAFALWILIVAAVTAVYWPALRGGLVWDDAEHVTPPELRSLGGLVRIWTELGATQQYYPLLHSFFWLQHKLWGDATLGYHLVQVLLHSTAAVLLAAVIRRLLGSAGQMPGSSEVQRSGGSEGQRSGPPKLRISEPRANIAALIGAAIFALHPVHVESVAWISEQKNTLSTVFYLWSALVYLKFDDTRARGANLLASLLFVCALLTKSVTATLPAALLVALWWKRGGQLSRKDIAPLVPWLIVGASMGLFTAWVERHHIGASGAEFALGPIERSLLAARIIVFYLGKFLWPADLIFIYPRWQVGGSDPVQWLYPLALVVLLVALFLLRRRTRAPLAAFLFFCGSLFPVLGFFNVYPFRYSYVADHWLYLPSIGMVVLVAAIVGKLVASGIGPRASGIGLPVPLASGISICAALAMYAALARQHARAYADAETFYRTILARNPDAWLAQFNLGSLLVEKGRAADAVPLIERAKASRPKDVQILNQEALTEFEAALSRGLDTADVRMDAGACLYNLRRFTEAIAHFEAALRLDPGSADARARLAAATQAAGK